MTNGQGVPEKITRDFMEQRIKDMAWKLGQWGFYTLQCPLACVDPLPSSEAMFNHKAYAVATTILDALINETPRPPKGTVTPEIFEQLMATVHREYVRLILIEAVKALNAAPPSSVS